MTLTTLDPPVQALVSLWDPAVLRRPGDHRAGHPRAARRTRRRVSGHRVRADAAGADTAGERSPGLANMALLRRPADLDEATWLSWWHGSHTQVAIDTQSTFGYVQNYVVRGLTPDAPALSAIVEEQFPIEAVGSLHAFFGAADDADLSDRMQKMVASTSSFGASTNIDAVPTSRYRYRSPFRADVASRPTR